MNAEQQPNITNLLFVILGLVIGWTLFFFFTYDNIYENGYYDGIYYTGEFLACYDDKITSNLENKIIPSRVNVTKNYPAACCVSSGLGDSSFCEEFVNGFSVTSTVEYDNILPFWKVYIQNS